MSTENKAAKQEAKQEEELKDTNSNIIKEIVVEGAKVVEQRSPSIGVTLKSQGKNIEKLKELMTGEEYDMMKDIHSRMVKNWLKEQFSYEE